MLVLQVNWPALFNVGSDTVGTSKDSPSVLNTCPFCNVPDRHRDCRTRVGYLCTTDHAISWLHGDRARVVTNVLGYLHRQGTRLTCLGLPLRVTR